MKSITPYGAAALSAVISLACAQNSQALDLPATLYGKINVSFDSRNNAADDWVSNASRLGLKGKYELGNQLSVIYQVEQDVDYAHGGKHIDTLLGMRNSFVGLKSGFGSVYFGAHDTPLKLAQGKVDVFNDQVGDLKNVVVGEVRATDSWFYDSPQFGDGFKVSAAYVPADDIFDSSQSIMLSYQPDNLYLSLGYDADMRKNDKSASSTKVYDSLRGVAQYKWEGWQFGVLLQSSEQKNLATANREFAYSLSVQKAFSDFTVKLQHGESDIVGTDIRSTLVGVDYKLFSNTKIYAYYWDYNKGGDADVASIGFEYKF